MSPPDAALGSARSRVLLVVLAMVAIAPVWSTAVYSIALVLLLLAWLATAPWRRSGWRTPLAAGALVFMAGLALAALAAADQAAAWEEFRSYYPFLLLIFAADAVRGPKDLRFVGAAFLASSGVAAAAAVLQDLGLLHWQDSRFRGTVGIFEYAAAMVFGWSLCIGFLLEARSRWAMAGLCALSLLYLDAIRLNATRASLVALAASLVLLAWYGRARWPRLALALAPLLIAAPVAMSGELGARLERTESRISLDDPQNQRQVIWAYAWTMFADAPWLGAGPGAFVQTCAELRKDPRLVDHPRLKHPYRTAHSIPLHLMATSGLVGLAGFLAWAGAVAWFFVRAARRHAALAAPALAVFAAVLAFGATDMSMLNSRISGLLCLALGGCAGAIRGAEARATAALAPPPSRAA